MNKRVLILANHYLTLYAFRKELIGELLKQQYEVYLSLPESEDNVFFEKQGCRVIVTPIDRRGTNPVRDLKLLGFYKKLMAEIDPAVVLSYTIKPNIYGAMAANRKGCRQICNITGTGDTFQKNGLLSLVCRTLYRRSVKYADKVFFQNPDDLRLFREHRLIGDNAEVIPGSGCNLDEHPYSPLPPGKELCFLFAGRIKKSKGIADYLRAAEAVKRRHPNTAFYVAGFVEEEDCHLLVEAYERRGVIEYLGFCRDIGDRIRDCHCVVVPSRYREGMSNTLLEAAATGRVCIGSDVPGVRDAIRDGETGYLFEAGSVDALTDRIETFISLPFEQKTRMGLAGRNTVEQRFDRQIVVHRYMQEIEKRSVPNVHGSV